MEYNRPKIDVHVLHLPTTDNTLWQECRESLRDEPINLHILDGVPGHIGKARYAGFTQGASPYVSCVDPDDLVIDHAGKVIKPGIWSQTQWNPLLQLEPKYLHHIYVMRRCFAEKCYLEMLRWPSMPEYILKCLLTAHGLWVHVNRFGYKWRLRRGSTHNRVSPTIICAAQWRVIPILQQAAKVHKAVIRTELF